MTARQTRMVMLVAGLCALAGFVAVALFALQDNLVYFHSPSDIMEERPPPHVTLRIGGLVAQGSLMRDGTQQKFIITYGAADIMVHHTGLLPDLFREGQGVVAEGKLNASGIFMATTILAKHDENYMPPEVAEALKQSGLWRDEQYND